MKRSKKTNLEKGKLTGKRAILISESSVFTDNKGQLISKGGGEGSFHKLGMALVTLGLKVKVIAIQEFPEQKKYEFIDGVEYVRHPVKSKTSLKILGYLKHSITEAREADYVFVNQFSPHLILPFIGSKTKGNRKSDSENNYQCKKIAVIHDVYKGKGLKFWVRQFGLVAGIIGSIVENFQLKFDKKYADKILTVSEESKAKILKEFSKKISVVTWPVEGTNHKVSLKDKKDFILFVGRFVDYKNPSHVLHVLKEIKKTYPRFQAVFVVSRIDKKTMAQFTDTRYKLSLTARDVVIEEGISTDKLQSYYKAAKLLVHPSFVEGQGMVIPEALAWKTPVVAYDLEAYSMLKKETIGLNTVKQKKSVKGLNTTCLKILRNYKSNFEKVGINMGKNRKTFSKIIKSFL